eukprot:scaffold5828_cov168-Amphora_coffeaeformis.AAC.27
MISATGKSSPTVIGRYNTIYGTILLWYHTIAEQDEESKNAHSQEEVSPETTWLVWFALSYILFWSQFSNDLILPCFPDCYLHRERNFSRGVYGWHGTIPVATGNGLGLDGRGRRNSRRVICTVHDTKTWISWIRWLPVGGETDGGAPVNYAAGYANSLSLDNDGVSLAIGDVGVGDSAGLGPVRIFKFV